MSRDAIDHAAMALYQQQKWDEMVDAFAKHEADKRFTKDQQRFALNCFSLFKMISDRYITYRWTF